MADDPIRPEHRDTMNDIARLIEGAINATGQKKTGFVLLVFDFGPGGFMNYISNADRDDVVKAMEEWISRQVSRN